MKLQGGWKFQNSCTVHEMYLLQRNRIDPVSGEELSCDLAVCNPYLEGAWQTAADRVEKLRIKNVPR